eukprot:m.330150 g.330150  ORF g.330150 m.330150 type:complete len:297 (-) comp55606_c0_seq4:229-1119(-)
MRVAGLPAPSSPTQQVDAEPAWMSLLDENPQSPGQAEATAVHATEEAPSWPSGLIPAEIREQEEEYDSVSQLIDAVRMRNLNECKQLVHLHGASLIVALCPGGMFAGDSALHWVAYKNNGAIMQWFLEQNINCNGQNSMGRTALMDAALHGAAECTQLLLSHGADASIKDENERTALEDAQRRGHASVVLLLEEHARYLAQLGSHTKPALRGPLHPAAQPEGVAEAVALPQSNLLLMIDGQRAGEPVAPLDSEGEVVGLSDEGDAGTDVAPLSVRPETQQTPLMLDLSDLDFQLPE